MTTSPGQASWFGQPPGLTILFLTEMWEKFSYYGMRAILIYYMVKHLHLPQNQASHVYGIYTAFVYFTPIIGGLISDRWLGRRSCVLIGGSIMAAGHFMMAFEPLFYFALATITIGNGLYLPSLPSQITLLYADDDPRKKSAYNFYYQGVNLGAFAAPFAVGTVGEVYGWHWGFSLAGVGMLTGLLTYILGGHHLPPEPARAPRPARTGPRPSLSPEARQRFALLGAIVLVVIIFRAGYEQIGNTLALWIDSTDRNAFGFNIPRTWFQSINPLGIILGTPVIVAAWLAAARRGKEPSTIRKMVLGASLNALGYLLLTAVSASAQAHGHAVGWGWIVAFFVVMTLGELYILPVGLGLFGRLAPPGFNATAIALWFLAAFFGNLAAGMLGGLYSTMAPTVFFLLIAGVFILSAILLHPFNKAVRAAEMSIA